MGMIYARTFLRYNIVSKENLLLIEKNESRRDLLKSMQAGSVSISGDVRIAGSDLIILAVKPQDFDELAVTLKKMIRPHHIVISIMAGMTMKYIAEKTGHEKIVRAMPNSPAEYGMGITGYICSPALSVSEIHLAENLLASTGRTVFFEEEEMLNAVTALSGSGPAYFFYIIKNMIEAGVKMGMSEHVAATLVKQTMLGSFHLVNNEEKSMDELISAVASRGGTTEAALQVFEKARVGHHIQEGIVSARNRAQTLAK